MQLFKEQTRVDFMGKRSLALILSLVLMAASIFSLATRGLQLGIDFTGGTLIEVGYRDSIDPAEVRRVLAENGFDGAIVQSFGTSRDVLIRLAPREDRSSAQISDEMLKHLHQAYPDQVELRRVEFVGPQIGEELSNDGGLAMLYALIGILIYVAFRFEKRFSVGAVLALIHDVVITLGLFSIFALDFDLSVLAALLAVIGYSLNDTIVVYDRIRENFRKIRKGTTMDIMNTSINQTLSRTLITSLTTLLVLSALFVFGGEIIHGFSQALIFGVVVGTYSSIYVAGSSILILGISREDLMPLAKEGAEVDDRP